MLKNEKRRFCVRSIDVSRVIERFDEGECDLYMKDGRVLTARLNLYVAKRGGLSTCKMRTSAFLKECDPKTWMEIPCIRQQTGERVYDAERA